MATAKQCLLTYSEKIRSKLEENRYGEKTNAKTRVKREPERE
jgi:hypothetical protein